MATKATATKATKTNTTCIHKFIATGGKGLWQVEAISLNKRGKPKIQNVTTTIFLCKKCGEKKEYPDTWERNFLLPQIVNTRRPVVKKGHAGSTA